MYRIILVDDEPLILAGIASLISWEDHDCTIVGKATNGPSAYEMIMSQKPDIVITDIRMPVMDGLALMEKCQAAGFRCPFIVLTNLEEFSLARKALSLGACEYLVKLNLTPEELIKSLDRAKESCLMWERTKISREMPASLPELLGQYINRRVALGKQDAPLPEGLRPLIPQLYLLVFTVRHASIPFLPDKQTVDIKQLTPHIIDILGGLSSRFFHASAILPPPIFSHPNGFLMAAAIRPGETGQIVSTFCSKALNALKTYFELTAAFGISSPAGDESRLETCFKEAQTALEAYYYDSADPIVFYTGQTFHQSQARDFNINFLKKDLSASIQQNDSEKLGEIFRQIIDLFTQCRPGRAAAASACINIYSYLSSFFEQATDESQDIFPYTINIAGYITQFTSLADILAWLGSLRGQLCQLLDDRKNHVSDTLAQKAQQYVQEHYQEKLSLTEIAEYLNISTGYLSIVFKRFTGTTLSDYIAWVKIEHAKELIDSHQYLMYEISDMLGFENPYYFSRVFKKVTGISPRNYEKRT